MVCFKSLLKLSSRRYKLSACLLLMVVSATYLIEITYFKSRKEKNEDMESLFLKGINQNGFEGENLIHFDLKGAPPKLSYLLSLFPLIKKLGASGILLEYEDMFPYRSELEGISALNAYTRSDVAAIIETARKENLSVIPLIPTFSHLEFVLKLERYRELREVDESPQVLCPSRANGLALVKKMIDQILEAHNTSKYLHIGCDEVELLGLCDKCQEMQRKNKWLRDTIYFNHVQAIAQYVVTAHPGVRPILWADKFIKKNRRLTAKLVDLVDVMFWNYKPKKDTFPSQTDMDEFVKSFKNIWIANAFKGATGSTQIVTNIDYHLKNTQGWMNFYNKWKTKINFKGIALTGWQRYNHFSALCELFPVGIPSLALNLQYLNENGLDHNEIKDALNCTQSVPVGLLEILDVPRLAKLKCDFPGFEIYLKIHSYYNSLQQFKSSLTVLQNRQFGFSNANDLDPTFILRLKKNTFNRHLMELDELEIELQAVLGKVYDRDTVAEWMGTHVTPVRILLEAAANTINKIRGTKAWPRRPTANGMLQAKKLFDSICNSNETTGCSCLQIHV